MRRHAHHLIRTLAAIGLGAAPLGCGPTVSLEDTSDETGTTGTSGDDGEGDGDEPDSGEPGEPFAGLPNPAAFGMRFDPDAPTMQPQTLRIDAPRLHALDPGIESIEIVHDLDPRQSGGWFFDLTVEVRALGASCDPEGSILFSYDSRTPEVALPLEPAKLDALLEDLQQSARRGRCSVEPQAIAPVGPPGGPNWWAVTPCEGDYAAYTTARTAVLAAHAVLVASVPSWRAECELLPEPNAIAACQSLVTAIQSDMTNAALRRVAASQMVEAQRELVNEAMDIAADNALGAAGLANFNPAAVVQLAQLAVWSSGLRWAIENQSAIAVGNLSSARILASTHPALYIAVVELDAALAVYGTWALAVDELAGCQDRVTRWIAAAAAIGFGIRFLFPPGGLGGVAEGGKASDSDSTLVFGLSHPQAMAQHWANPIVLDLDLMPSLTALGTRQDAGGKVSRSILAGYEFPHDVTLPSDIMVPEPFTLIPIVAAPAGAPLVLDETQLEDGVPRVRYEYGKLRFQGAYLDLQWENVDASGNSLDGLWAKCKVVLPLIPPPSPWWPHCGLSMETWASPEDIAAGRLFSRYWHIASTGGIVDPSSGDVVESSSGFFVNLRKTAERPDDPCYVWDYEDEQYVWDQTLPDCGPVGVDDGGVEDGGDAGDGSVGDDGPPPPPPPPFP